MTVTDLSKMISKAAKNGSAPTRAVMSADDVCSLQLDLLPRATGTVSESTARPASRESGYAMTIYGVDIFVGDAPIGAPRFDG